MKDEPIEGILHKYQVVDYDADNDVIDIITKDGGRSIVGKFKFSVRLSKCPIMEIKFVTTDADYAYLLTQLIVDNMHGKLTLV